MNLPPYQHRFIDTGISRIHYAELPGDGPPLVLLHGIGMDWRVWQALSRRLHPHFHLYLPDLRGHGESSKPETGYSLADYAADIEDVIDALGLEGTALCGSSLGGMVAAAVEAPSDLVARRVLVDPPLTGGPIRDAAMFEEILRLKHEAVPALASFLGEHNPGAGTFYLRTMSEMWHEAADGVITDMLANPLEYYDLSGALELIDAPVLLVGADPARGAVLGEVEAARALAMLPNGTFIRIPGATHAVHASKPAEFAGLLLAFTLGPTR